LTVYFPVILACNDPFIGEQIFRIRLERLAGLGQGLRSVDTSSLEYQWSHSTLFSLGLRVPFCSIWIYHFGFGFVDLVFRFSFILFETSAKFYSLSFIDSSDVTHRREPVMSNTSSSSGISYPRETRGVTKWYQSDRSKGLKLK
jgi:hypothetical protein